MCISWEEGSIHWRNNTIIITGIKESYLSGLDFQEWLLKEKPAPRASLRFKGKRERERDSIIKAKTVKYLLLVIWDGSGRRTEDPESVYLS